MTLTMNNAAGRQQPLGERSLNFSETQRGAIDRDGVKGLKVQNGVRPEVCYNPRMQPCSVPSKSNIYTPNHRRSRNAPFKSPITLCFDRMLGAGKFVVVIVELNEFDFLLETVSLIDALT